MPLADVGFAATLPAAPTGGALVPLVVVDLVSAGARGFVSGFGRFGDGAFPVLAARFIAVRDGWRVLLGRLAPIAGSFRGWSSPSCSSSMVALRLRVTLVASDGPDSVLSGDELLRRGNLDILCSCPLLWRTVTRRAATATTTMSKRRRQCLKFNKTRESCDGDSDFSLRRSFFFVFSPEPQLAPL